MYRTALLRLRAGLRTGERMSLVVMGLDYAALSIERTKDGTTIGTIGCRQADKGGGK